MRLFFRLLVDQQVQRARKKRLEVEAAVKQVWGDDRSNVVRIYLCTLMVDLISAAARIPVW